MPAIIEQKVTGQEAFAGFRALVHRLRRTRTRPRREHEALGASPRRDRADDPVAGRGWRCTSTRPARARSSPRPGWPTRSSGTTAPRTLDRRLRSLPGIGVWTSAEVRQRALGDPDAVSFVDYHVAKDVGWAMTGTPFNDAELEEFLEPWRPHRNRAVPGDYSPSPGRSAATRTADVAAHPPAGRTPGSR